MRTLEVGDVATVDDVIGIYAQDVAEDGCTECTYYDLRDDRLGFQSVSLGKPVDPVIYVVA